MTIAANVVIGVIALLHVYFLVLEMFLWDKPFGLRTFRQTLTAAQTFKVLAANQGPYRLLGGGPGGVGPEPGHCGTGVKMFFLSCVLVAGLYGAATVGREILFAQALPAAIGLALVFLA